MTRDSLLSAKRLPIALAAFAVFASFMTLAGWAFGIERLTDWNGDGIVQLPNNALSVVLVGCGLIAAVLGMRRIAVITAAIGGAIGAATFFEHLTGVSLHIDTLLFHVPIGRAVTAPGRMGLPASVSLTILGIGVILRAMRRGEHVSIAAGLTTVAITMLSLIGYVFGADLLYSLPRLTAIAGQSSMVLLAIAVALLASIPEHAPARLLIGRTAAAMLARRSLPILIALPTIAGWLRVRGQQAGLFDLAFGTALLVLTLITFLAGLLWWSAAAIDKYEARLRRNADALLAADRMKDEFLATLSHELRTPLTAIIGWSDMLLLRAVDEQQAAIGLQAIRASAKAQSQLVEDVLDVSRIVTGKLRLERAEANLAAIVEAAIETVVPAAEAKRIALVVDIESRPHAYIDGSRVQQIVWNLLSNAIKFSRADTTVRVALRNEQGAAVIEVSDQGVGIEPDFLPHVFERFRQADSSASRRHSGLGIGLALTKDLVELHGGTIEAASELGRGSRFTVRLPLTAAPSATAAVKSTPDASLLDGVSVLYVDDRDDARLLVSAMLRMHGASVRSAESVDDALGSLSKEEPDVVLTDIAMPGRDGYELLASIRGDARWQHIPVMALTAQARFDDESSASGAGFRAFLRKPIEPHELAAAVEKVARGQ